MLTNGLNQTQANSKELKITSLFEQFQESNQLSDTLTTKSLKSSYHVRCIDSTQHLSTTLQHTKRNSILKQVRNSQPISQHSKGSALATTSYSSTLLPGSYEVTVQPAASTTASSSASQQLHQSSVTSGDWFNQTFYDLGIANLTRSLFATDGMITRNDMIAIFREVEHDNVVSGYEFTDLHTLVADGTLLKMPTYVQVLAAKVIGNDIANLSFQGTYLGDLQVGSSGAQLEELVDKWFLGLDLPASSITSGSSARSIMYGYVSGSLFGTTGSPKLTDIQQGDLGDCYFLASLGATVLQDPSAIQNMFIDNGDGTFTVRLFPEYDGVPSQTPDYVTVNRDLPINVYGNGTYGNQFAAYSQTTGLWVALAEKAYAQFAEEEVSQRNNANPDGTGTGYVPNNYGSIEGGWGFRTMPSLTGRAAGYFANAPRSGVDPNSYLGSLPSLQTIASALSQGYALTADTNGSSDSFTDLNTGIVLDHEYVVAGVNLSNGTLTLYNPWGDSFNYTGDSDGFKVISYNSFMSDLSAINIG